MSIYGSRRDRAFDDDLAWEKVLQKGAAPEAHPAADPPPSAEDLARLRKANPADYLLPASVNWLRALPNESRPIVLATEYPRVINLIVLHWNDAAAGHAYFDELLVGRRPGRRGFPAAAHREIVALRKHFDRWQLAQGRSDD